MYFLELMKQTQQLKVKLINTMKYPVVIKSFYGTYLYIATLQPP